MPRWALELYISKLPGLIAEQQMAMATAAAYPHMKKSNQQGLMRRLRRMVGRGEKAEAIESPEAAEAIGFKVIYEGERPSKPEAEQVDSSPAP